MHSPIRTLAVAVTLAAAGMAQAAPGGGHLNVRVDQHVQAGFLASPPGSNVYRLAALVFPDGTVVTGSRVPRDATLVLTDVHTQIFRSGEVSQPLDGMIQLGSFDETGVKEAIQFTNVPLVAAGNQLRTGTTHSFTAGFAFKGDRSPGFVVLTDATVSDLHITASGYLVRR